VATVAVFLGWFWSFHAVIGCHWILHSLQFPTVASRMRNRKRKKKGTAVPTRFDEPETEVLEELRDRTGLSKSEIVRRSVRLLAARVAKEDDVGFILSELSPKPNSKPKKLEK
jgi:Ribbon-helix-helix protein, copG family